jgi:hypothetical protein
MAAAVLCKRSDGQVSIPAAAATVVSPGDMVFRSTSTGKALPLSDQVDQTSEELNQRLARKTFLGHARTGKTASEAEKDILVGVDLEDEYAITCVSETHEIGDLLGPDEQASGTALENQKLVKVSNLSQATHVCVKRDSSAATTVRCRMITSVARPTVANGKELMFLGSFQWAAIANGDLRTAILLPFKGALISIFAMVDEPMVGAAGTCTVNAEIDAVDVTGGVVTVSTAAGGTRGAKLDGTAITAANTFAEGSVLDIEAAAAGGTRTSGRFDLWAVIERRPG